MNTEFAPLRPAAPPPLDFRPAYAAALPPAPAPDSAADVIDRQMGLLEEARAAGYAAGLTAGRQAIEAVGQERVARALEDLRAALDAARDLASATAQSAAAELAVLTHAMIEAAAPGLVARAAPALLARLAEELRPRLGLMTNPRMAVAPDMAALLAPVLAAEPMELIEDAAVAPGDARITWDDGELRMNRAARMAALRTALANAGLALED